MSGIRVSLAAKTVGIRVSRSAQMAGIKASRPAKTDGIKMALGLTEGRIRTGRAPIIIGIMVSLEIMGLGTVDSRDMDSRCREFRSARKKNAIITGQ